MAERSTNKFARVNNSLSDKPYPAALRTGSARSRSEIPGDDDLIITLSQRYENRRAVQVFEWESIRRSGSFSRETMT
jgi:hypothetical protein